MWWARHPSAGALAAPPAGVHCGMLPQQVSSRATSTRGSSRRGRTVAVARSPQHDHTPTPQHGHLTARAHLRWARILIRPLLSPCGAGRRAKGHAATSRAWSEGVLPAVAGSTPQAEPPPAGETPYTACHRQPLGISRAAAAARATWRRSRHLPPAPGKPLGATETHPYARRRVTTIPECRGALPCTTSRRTRTSGPSTPLFWSTAHGRAPRCQKNPGREQGDTGTA